MYKDKYARDQKSLENKSIGFIYKNSCFSFTSLNEFHSASLEENEKSMNLSILYAFLVCILSITVFKNISEFKTFHFKYRKGFWNCIEIL